MAVGFVLAEGALPVLVLIAMGRVTGRSPARWSMAWAPRTGTGCSSSSRWRAGIYAVSLMRGPVEDALTAAATARVDVLMQEQLVGAVTAPVGIEPLEDQDVLERLASARGELLGSQPAGAPMALISNLGDRLTGILACLVLATFRWYLGVGLLVMWLIVRRPLGQLIRSRTSRARQAGAAAAAQLVHARPGLEAVRRQGDARVRARRLGGRASSQRVAGGDGALVARGAPPRRPRVGGRGDRAVPPTWPSR